MKRTILFFVLIILNLKFVYSQTISGRVIDGWSGSPMSGIIVQIKGTSIGTYTNFDGYYELNITSQKNFILSAKYIFSNEFSIGPLNVLQDTVINILLGADSLNSNCVRTSVIFGEVNSDSTEHDFNSRIFWFPHVGKISKNKNGNFYLSDLCPGKYSVLIYKYGFIPKIIEPIILEGEDTARIKINLEKMKDPNDTIFYDTPTISNILADSSILRKFNEPLIYENIDTTKILEIYRFIWVRTFHHPIIVRLEINKDSSATAYYKEFDGAGGYDFGKLIRNEKINVLDNLKKEFGNNEKRAKEYINYLRINSLEKFWNQPYDFDLNQIGLDGASWIVEGRTAFNYHKVTRWCPNINDPIRNFAWSLINLLRKRFFYDEVY